MGYQEIAQHTFDLAHLMMNVGGGELYVIAGIYNDDDREERAVVKGWAGGEPPYPFKTTIETVTQLHALEVMMGGFDEEFVMSPVARRVITGGKMGAVRCMNDDCFQDVTSVGGEAERCNAMIALLLCKAMEHEVRFHHVTFGYTDLDELLDGVTADHKRLGIEPVHLPQEGRNRYVFRIEDEQAPNGVYWTEHAYGQGVRPWSIQWHIVMDSYKYLEQAQKVFPGETTIYQDTKPGGLEGEIWHFANNVHLAGLAFYDKWVELS